MLLSSLRVVVEVLQSIVLMVFRPVRGYFAQGIAWLVIHETDLGFNNRNIDEGEGVVKRAVADS